MKFTADIYGVPISAGRRPPPCQAFSLADWSDELLMSGLHGMKQKLIMAAALLHEPEVLIVDEPMVR